MSGDDIEQVDQLAQVWGSIAAVSGRLDEREWATPTECPGWSVQDNVAHVIGIEATILGRPAPTHDAPARPHVKNEVGARNEVWVDWYRARPGNEVLADFRTVTAERLAQLREPGYDFGADTWTPIGPGTVRDLLPFRVFDSWVHGQDIRRAVDRPGDFDTPAARVALDRIAAAMPMVVGKKVAPPDGTTIVFVLTGPSGRTLSIGMEAGRASQLGVVPDAPTVHFELDGEAFTRLGTGRGDPDAIVASGAVRLTGDRSLGRALARQMNFLF